MNFTELYQLLEEWVWYDDIRCFRQPVRMRLTGITVRKPEGKYRLSCELTDTRGATYIVKAENIRKQVQSEENNG